MGTWWPRSPSCSPRAACITATPMQIYHQKKKTRKVEVEHVNKVSINACCDTTIKNMNTKRPLTSCMDAPQTVAQPLLKSSVQSISFPLIFPALHCSLFPCGKSPVKWPRMQRAQTRAKRGKKAFRTLDSQMFWVLEQCSRTVGALWTKISVEHMEACVPDKGLIQAHGRSSLFQHAAFDSTFRVLLSLSMHTRE